MCKAYILRPSSKMMTGPLLHCCLQVLLAWYTGAQHSRLDKSQEQQAERHARQVGSPLLCSKGTHGMGVTPDNIMLSCISGSVVVLCFLVPSSSQFQTDKSRSECVLSSFAVVYITNGLRLYKR